MTVYLCMTVYDCMTVYFLTIIRDDSEKNSPLGEQESDVPN